MTPDQTPAWVPPGPHFVLVTEGDGGDELARPAFRCDAYGIPEPTGEGVRGPITWEHYLGKGTQLETVRTNAGTFNRYGRTAIARLVFLTDEEVEALRTPIPCPAPPEGYTLHVYRCGRMTPPVPDSDLSTILQYTNAGRMQHQYGGAWVCPLSLPFAVPKDGVQFFASKPARKD
jgi:hypothetical protein